MRIIDLHCDTLYRCFLEKEPLNKNSFHIDIEKLRAGHSLAQFFAIFLPFEGVDLDGVHYDRYEMFQEVYKIYRNELEKNKAVLREALSAKDIERNQKEGFISAILTVEDGALLDGGQGKSGDMNRLYELYEKGVRLITLTWNYENCIGYPNSSDAKEHRKGLKPFGIDAVSEMNRLGIMVDVSHLSEGGFWDVAKYSEKPFVASHSCARSLCNHKRNLTDEQLRCISDKGGAVGVNYYSHFLREGCKHSNLEDILRHIEYMVNVAGEDAVALGSDFDGIECTLDMEDYSKMDRLVRELEARYSGRIVDKILKENALRVIADSMK